MSDRIAVMNGGRIEQIGTPNELYQRPNTWFLADFIGESNFIAGNILKIKTGHIEVKNNGNSIYGPKYDQIIPGKDVFVLLRPERLNIHIQQPTDSKNLIVGTIQDDPYVGNMSRYLIKISK